MVSLNEEIKKMFKRIIWIILDSVGIGEAPDADAFGDAGADTLGNIIKTRGHIQIPYLEQLGLFSIDGTSLPRNHIFMSSNLKYRIC